MDLVLIVTAGVFVSLGATLVFLFKKVVGQQSAPQLLQSWDGLFAPARYRPLERIMTGRDRAYIASVIGGRLEKRVRANRTKIINSYVRCLRKDFMRVLGALKQFMIHSPVDRPDLAPAILRHCIKFTMILVWVKLQLLLFRYGFGSIAVRGLLSSVTEIYGELRVTALAAQSRAA